MQRPCHVVETVQGKEHVQLICFFIDVVGLFDEVVAEHGEALVEHGRILDKLRTIEESREEVERTSGCQH